MPWAVTTTIQLTNAELIVKECADIARQHNNSGEGGVIAETIEEHFGVENCV